MAILVVGSIAFDSLQTPFGKRQRVLGGSATYFSMAASFFDTVHVVATVGTDFPAKHLALFKKRGIGTDGLVVAEGKTFHWQGRYGHDLNTAETIKTELNVFGDFRPEIPPHLQKCDILFLANIDPDLQGRVVSQMAKRPRLIACDSMNYWITHKRRSLERVVRATDIFFMNEGEARQFTGESNLIKAGHAVLSMGTKAVVIKKGEHGAIYLSKHMHFVTCAYPLESVFDPTGAGDTFAGGMIGYLSSRRTIRERDIRVAIAYGGILASFTVEDFGVERLQRLTPAQLKARYNHFRKLVCF